MLLHDLIRGAAVEFGDKTSIIFAKQACSFRTIDENSDRLACELQRLGVARGDRIVAMLDNSIEMVVALWATLKAGAVFVPVGPGTKAPELGFLLTDSGAACLIAHTNMRLQVTNATTLAQFQGFVMWAGGHVKSAEKSLDEIVAGPRLAPSDPGVIDQDLCLIIYTSGSTGTPKGVMMTHAAVCNNVVSIDAYLRNRPDDVVLCVLQLSYSYGLFQVLVGARVGYAVVLERSFAFPVDVLKRIGEHRVTGLPGVPTVFASILQLASSEGLDLSSLRYMTNAAAPLPAAHLLELRRVFPKVEFFSMYGLTECTRATYLEPSRVEQKPESAGRAMPNCEIYIVDEVGRRCGPGEIGELVVRGANLMRGYWRRPEETAAALREGDIPGEKVLYTGDLFWKDEEGDIFFVGRRDDVFKCRGEKISPREVEGCLYEHPGVAEAAVVGVPHPTDGFAVKAHVVAREGYEVSEETLRRHCRARLEAVLVPRFFEFCASLPKTDSGKITRAALRKGAGT